MAGKARRAKPGSRTAFAEGDAEIVSGGNVEGFWHVEQFDGSSKSYAFTSAREGREVWYMPVEPLPDCARCQGAGTLPVASCGQDGRWAFFAAACSCERGAMRRHHHPKLAWHDRATLGLWGLDAREIALVHNGLTRGGTYQDAILAIPVSGEDVARRLASVGVTRAPSMTKEQERGLLQQQARINRAIGAMLDRAQHTEGGR